MQHLPALVPLLKRVIRHQRCGRPRERRQIQIGHHLQSHNTRLLCSCPLLASIARADCSRVQCLCQSDLPLKPGLTIT